MWEHFWDWLGKLPQSSASFVGTLTGSSLGLIALLTGALVNASLNRRRDDRLRRHDRTAVATVLHAELTGMRRTLIENAEHLESNPPDPKQGFVVPAPSARLLDDATSKIGLLGTDAVRKVMDAYVLNEAYLTDLILAGGQQHPGTPEDRSLIFMPGRLAPFVAEFNRTRATAVDAALKALSPFL
ncbi:hypothetical protein [Bradyrhizobium sp. LA2.1]|uniref:hypothetical protein n=1 Tax=Bradyrhizobium sp. LA2.1 TaxID=3156376 RepID=UPI00339587F5